MATNIYVNLYASTLRAPGVPWSYNEFGSGFTGVGQVSSDLKDDSNASTGYTLDVINAFTAAAGNPAWATSGAGGWPADVFKDSWYVGASEDPSKLRIGGLSNGDSYTVEVAGHQGSQPTRDTNFTVGGTTTLYDATGTATPNPPISFSGTVSGTTLDIDAALVSTFGYVNGFKLVITPASTGFTIDTEPTETKTTEQGSFTISGPATVPTVVNTSIALENGGPTATIDSVTGSDPYTINYTLPKTTNKLFNSTGYVHEITIDAETADSSVIPYVPETGWDFVTLGTVDTGTDIYTEYAGSTWVSGDQAVWDTLSTPDGATVSIDNTLNWDISPAPTSNQTVGIYRIAANDTKDVDDTMTFVAGIPTGSRGSVNQIAYYLMSTGNYSSTQVNDIIKEWLTEEGYVGALNDMLNKYLGDAGYTGTIQDRMIKWSKDV